MKDTKLYIIDMHTGKKYLLQEGPQVAGRKDDLAPDIELETNDLYISRKHILLNVGKTPYATWCCNISNYGSPSNPVIVDGEELSEGDIVPLHIEESFILGYTEFKLIEE